MTLISVIRISVIGINVPFVDATFVGVKGPVHKWSPWVDPVLNPKGYCYESRVPVWLPTFSRLVFLYQPVDSETLSIQGYF